MTYNLLNLIQKVEKNGATLSNYSYLSDGTKLSATDASGNGLCYLGSLVYNKQGNTLTLESAAVPGGRIIKTNNGYDTRYFLTDHLGSVRAVVNNNGIVQEQSNYYAYGSRWNDGQMSDNRYHYNGKENQSFVDVPYLDYGARMYDPNTGRWFNVDPLAEITPGVSPFAFCNNNPMRYIDPTGLSTQASGADSLQVVPINPVVVEARRNNSGYANPILFIMWSAAGWGQMWNNAMGARNASFSQNMYTGLNIWQSFALSFGLSKISINLKFKGNYNTIKWSFGKHKTTQKWLAQMRARGWNIEQISEAISNGEKFKAVNYVNKSNSATRYVHPQTGKSVVVDDITHELLQVGGEDFKY